MGRLPIRLVNQVESGTSPSALMFSARGPPRTCIARNNADIYNNWSNPFDADTTLRLASGSTNKDSDGNDVVASQNVNYSPFLDQYGLGDSANIHGKNVWTGGFGSAVNPLGNSPDPDARVRASYGSSNANTGGRTWNRFQGDPRP